MKVFCNRIKKYFSLKGYRLLAVCAAFMCLSAFSVAAQDSALYWDSAKTLIRKNSCFPVTVNLNNNSYIFWQDVDTSKKQIYLSMRHYSSIDSYEDNLKFAGPFSYSGDIPDIFSVTSSDTGDLLLTVMSEASSITAYKSSDKGKTFTATKIDTSSQFLDPRVYYSSFGKYILFTSYSENSTYHIYSSESADGINWSSFTEFSPSKNLSNSFVPFLVKAAYGDVVVFQARYSSSVGKISYQLYQTVNTSGYSWSEPVLVTDKASLKSNERKNFVEFMNQRPYLFADGNKIYMVWERSAGVDTSIWGAELNQKGLVNGSSMQISRNGTASRGILFKYNNSIYSEWFTKEGSNSETVYYSSYDGLNWSKETKVLISDTNTSADKIANLFVYPLILKNENYKDELSFIWQKTTKSDNTNTISIIQPDKVVAAPVLTAVSYKNGKKSRDKSVQIRVSYPEDSSGIAGYSYSWGMDNEVLPDLEPVEYLSRYSTAKSTVLKFYTEDDGEYNLYVRVQDRAGNWSTPAKISYVKDSTPPLPPVFKIQDLDSYGMYNSNNPVIHWNPSESSDTAGYNYDFSYLGSIPKSLVVNKTHKIQLSKSAALNEVDKLKKKYQKNQSSKSALKNNIRTTRLRTALNENQNIKNGVYLISVSAIDDVGNVSPAARMLVILNKYQPATVISTVDSKADEFGRTKFSIRGSGFTYEGTVDEIYVDIDGQEPYDLVLKQSDGDFIIESDTKITDIKIESYLEKGKYRIGLKHSDRGVIFTAPVLDIKQTGTIKIQPEFEYKPKYHRVDGLSLYIIPVAAIVVILIILILLGIPQILAVSVIQKTKDDILTRKEINSLISGEDMPLKSRSMAKKGSRKSLRTRIVLFTVALVILVVGVITWINVTNVINIQQTSLISALQDRINVLMVSMNSNLKNNLPVENIDELGMLPAQTDGIAEVKYATILGRKRGVETSDEDYNLLEYVWASNDPDISDKIMTISTSGEESVDLIAGRSRIIDEEILKNLTGLYAVQNEAKEKIYSKIQEISLNSEQIRKMYEDGDDVYGDKLAERNMEIRIEITQILSDFATEKAYTVPQIPKDILHATEMNYIFYRPVLYNIGSSDKYMNGLIILEVSLQELVDQINSEVRNIIYQNLIIGAIAIIFGIIGSWVVATFIVKPIKNLETHIQQVGNLLTKSPRERMRLQKMEIKIKSKDEIGRLGAVVNKMALTVGNAAEDDYLNKDGKKVQNRFIPLTEIDGGEKLPFAKLQEEKLELFAFYKGDSDVSGDYFDYKKLDDKWYVFIKCDVSGHGVPAALIVSVVATKFKEFYYFSNWKASKERINIADFVSAVNDFIFELGARGKFSTINISLYNKENGEIYICNAGDNKIHILDGKTKRLKEIVLANLPTAGGVSNDMIEMKGGFKVEKLQLNHGDVLYLYTDGIDEAERLVREKNFEVRTTIITEEKFNRQTRKMEKEEKKNDVKEQFGQERITQIIEAVQRKEIYILEKEDNPLNEVLEFDFSTCEGTIDETIIALAAIERVFRMLKLPDVQENDEIEMEAQLDEFLKNHFSLYSKYCIPVNKNSGQNKKKRKQKKNQTAEDEAAEKTENKNAVRYAFVSEDPQADDITLIAIKRP